MQHQELLQPSCDYELSQSEGVKATDGQSLGPQDGIGCCISPLWDFLLCEIILAIIFSPLNYSF